MKKNTNKKIAKITTKLMEFVLKSEVNSNSSYMAYQPKAPEKFSRFKNNK